MTRKTEFKNAANAKTWYHGSMQKLEPGQYLVSPSENPRKAKTVNGQYAKGNKYNRNKVYVTQQYGVAFIFANPDRKPRGHVYPERGYVYEVEPIGKLEDDPDLAPHGLSAQTCDAARVIRVVKEGDAVVGGLPFTKAPKTAADLPQTKYFSTNSYAGKCRECSKKVDERSGVLVKTLRKPPYGPKYEVYHKECLND